MTPPDPSPKLRPTTNNQGDGEWRTESDKHPRHNERRHARCMPPTDMERTPSPPCEAMEVSNGLSATV